MRTKILSHRARAPRELYPGTGALRAGVVAVSGCSPADKGSFQVLTTRLGEPPKLPVWRFLTRPLNRVKHHFGCRLKMKLFLDAVAEGIDGGYGHVEILGDLPCALAVA